MPTNRLRHLLTDFDVRFTQAGAFNDPFELVPQLALPKEVQPRGKRTYRFELTASRRRSIHSETIDKDRCSDHHSRDIRDALDNAVGFFSLSKTCWSLPMWAHYACKYSGAVIEFDGDHDFFADAFSIHYSHHRPIRNWNAYVNGPIPIAELCDKSIEWEYEQEVRLARCLSDCRLVCDSGEFPVYVMDIPSRCIKRVILGERFDQSLMLDVFRKIKDTDIKGDWAYLDHWSYNLKLWPFKFSYPSGGRIVSSPVFRNHRDFPSL